MTGAALGGCQPDQQVRVTRLGLAGLREQGFRRMKIGVDTVQILCFRRDGLGQARAKFFGILECFEHRLLTFR